jgi:AraC-like DNA-binding protein
MVGAMAGTASRMAVHAALEAMARRGIDSTPIIRASGLTPELLVSVDARFPFENAQALWDRAAVAAGDPSFGLHVATELPEGYGLLDYLFCTSATLLQGYQRLSQFIRIAYDESDLRALDEPLYLRLTRSAAGCSRQYDEFLFGVLLMRGRQASGIDWTPLRAAFGYAEPADRSALTAAFRCPLTFGVAVTELVLDRALGDTALLKAESPLHSLLMEYAQALLARLPARSDLEGRMRAVILKEMPLRLPAFESVARTLKLPPRSLQRRLKERGTSFARVLDEIRRELALRYLADASLSVGEITFLLHFSEVAAFDRAFKRWMLTTPSAYRAALWTKPGLPPRAR